MKKGVMTYQSGMHASHSTKMDLKWHNQCKKISPLRNYNGPLNDVNFNEPLNDLNSKNNPINCATHLVSKKVRIPQKRVPNVPHEI